MDKIVRRRGDTLKRYSEGLSLESVTYKGNITGLLKSSQILHETLLKFLAREAPNMGDRTAHSWKFLKKGSGRTVRDARVTYYDAVINFLNSIYIVARFLHTY